MLVAFVRLPLREICREHGRTIVGRRMDMRAMTIASRCVSEAASVASSPPPSPELPSNAGVGGPAGAGPATWTFAGV